MKTELFRARTGRRVFAVLGDPVGQVRSDALFSEYFEKNDVDPNKPLTIKLDMTPETFSLKHSKYNWTIEPIWLTEQGERVVLKRLCNAKFKGTDDFCLNSAKDNGFCAIHKKWEK